MCDILCILGPQDVFGKIQNLKNIFFDAKYIFIFVFLKILVVQPRKTALRGQKQLSFFFKKKEIMIFTFFSLKYWLFTPKKLPSRATNP